MIEETGERRRAKGESNPQEQNSSGWKRWAQRLSSGLSLLLGLFFAFCYLRRPDACAAVTVWPVWIWVAPGLLFAALACERKRLRPLKLGALFWLLFLLIFAEEPKSLLRWNAGAPPNWEALRREGKALRVLSINCGGGVKEALQEAAALNPDIILVQEKPNRAALEEVAEQLFGKEGSVLAGLDCALIVRGKIAPSPLPPRVGFFAQARIQRASGPEIEVVSLHTMVPPVLTELWNLAVWRAYRTHRETQRNQMQIVARQMAKVPVSVPMIVGGDFNAPQGDAIFRLLQPRLRDTFPEAGTGWGNTIINDLPALRIDQIWVSEHFRPVRVYALKTQYSDHRLVVCDLLLVPRHE